MSAKPRILLTSVFGPYGVDDAYGRKENVMELFHNQVTREQGLFSLRFHHQSFGLYLIAENLNAETTILDFPSQRRFIREIRGDQYDYIGISFIVPNFLKAKRMAELVRQHAPRAKIVLGGHGTSIADVEAQIPHDHICRGEGVRFMRELLGEDPTRPIAHPMVDASFKKHLMGIPLAADGVVLMPGVGCVNGCRFCCTSHFYQREYTPFFRTGREIFDFCARAERERGCTDFFVMDENFLKSRQRAEELLAEMEQRDKHYTFSIFSSAETVRAVGVEFMKRLGVTFIWIGMEGRRAAYEKNQGVDFPKLVQELRGAGIVVLGSVILFTEEHTKETIHHDIDFAIEAGPDFIQFMQLGPMPGTTLYKDLRARGWMDNPPAFAEWHGQHRLWFDHPNFTAEESEVYLRDAFRRAWDELGASLLRLIETQLNGYLSSRGATDPALVARNKYYAQTCRDYYAGLYVIRRFAHNEFERDEAERVIARYDDAFGPLSAWQRTRAIAAQALAAIEAARIKTIGNMRQPNTLVTRFRPVPVRAASPVAARHTRPAEAPGV
jgi:hypothetical protein